MFENRRMRAMVLDWMVRPLVRGFADPRVGTGSTLIQDIDLIRVMEVSR